MRAGFRRVFSRTAGAQLLRILTIYLASRLVLLLVAMFSSLVPHLYYQQPPDAVGEIPSHASTYFGQIPSRWDGGFYESISVSGYGSGRTPAGLGKIEAFFPGYPLVLRAVRAVVHQPAWRAGPYLTVLLGAIAAILLWYLARDLFDASVADGAVLLYSFAPGSFVLSMAYSEGLMLAAVCACFLALRHERWLLAGLTAAVATATHVTALGLVLGIAVEAVLARRRGHRSLAALTAVVLAPTGAVAYFVWLHHISGSWTRWFDVQRAAWGTRGLDLLVPWHQALIALDHPLVSRRGTILVDELVETICLGLFLFGLAAMAYRRVPASQVVYVAFAGVSSLFSIGMHPRFLFVLIPLYVAVAALPALLTRTALAVSASLMMVFAGLSWAGLFAGP